MKHDSGGRVEQPSLNMKVMCYNEPWRDSQSQHVRAKEAVEMNGSSLDRSFMCFFYSSNTLQCSSSHWKPMYLTEKAKSWPFLSIGCHGMPRGSVMQKTNGRSKLYERAELPERIEWEGV